MKPLTRTGGARDAAVEAKLSELTLDEQQPRKRNGLTAIGVGRAVPANVLARGQWTTLASGDRVWRVAIHSPKAWGLRLHFTDFNVGDGHVWIYVNNTNPAEETFAGPYTGKGLFGDGEFWSEPVEGESVAIEYAPAASATGDDVPFHVDQLSHLYSKPLRKSPAASLNIVTRGQADTDLGALAATDNAAATTTTCSPDVSCYAQWSTAASAVASITFISNGDSYICTGSLIEDNNKTGQPLFLTANHCISDAATAKTVVAHFQYHSSVCNGAIPSYSQVPKVAGAQYLVSRPIAQGDFSLMLLSGAAPAGTTFLSWSGATDPQIGEAVIAIHHPGILPDGSAPTGARISFGTRDYPQDSDVEGEIMPASVNLAVNWTPGQGYTEPGSSGSPLLSSTGKLIGTLTGGAEGTALTQCNPTYAVAVYGRFSNARATLAPYMDANAGSVSPSPSTPAVPATACSYSFPGGPVTIAPNGGSGTVPVVANAGCGVQPLPTRPWISAAASLSATGDGSITYFASPNFSTLPRIGAIQTGSQAVQVLQKSAYASQSYADVPAANPWFDYVSILRYAGVIYGCNATQFCPDDPINRADMAVFLIRAMLGTGSFTYSQTPYFGDVQPGSPYFPYIQKLKELGVTNGCNPVTPMYCPNQTVTRLHMAKFLVLAKAGSNFTYTKDAYFDDVPATDPLFPFVQKMRDLGITSGCGTRVYCAGAGNTRGQISVFLARIWFSGVTF